MKIFGERLRQLRIRRNLTQEELAKILGVSKSTFYRSCEICQKVAKSQQKRGVGVSSLTKCQDCLKY